MPKAAQPKTSSKSGGDILGFKSEVFTEILKWGLIGGAVAGVIEFVGSVLVSLFSWLSLLGLGLGGFFSIFSIIGLFGDVFWGAVWGAFVALFVIKLKDKLPLKSLFMKLFWAYVIIGLVIALLFGIFTLIFVGPLSFLIQIASIVVAGLVFAKLVASKTENLI